MTGSERPKVGEFSLIDEDWVALGYRFPSGYIVMEWVDIPPDADKVDHQSIYHTWADLRTVYKTAMIEWGDSK